MLKYDDKIKGIDIEISLTPEQQAALSANVRTLGFDVVQLLMEDQVRRFNLKLINTNPADREEVLANHYLAKAVAQFYTGLMERIESVCQIEAYNNSTLGTIANPENPMAGKQEEFDELRY